MSPSRRPQVHARPVSLALTLLALAGCSDLGLQGQGAQLPADGAVADASVRTTPVVPGRPARVFVLASFGKRCEPLTAPDITITQRPAKGEISFVPGQETTIEHSAQGSCIGQKAQGTGIYYVARAGQQGVDRFSIAAKSASGESTTRTFEVRIAD